MGVFFPSSFYPTPKLFPAPRHLFHYSPLHSSPNPVSHVSIPTCTGRALLFPLHTCVHTSPTPLSIMFLILHVYRMTVRFFLIENNKMAWICDLGQWWPHAPAALHIVFIIISPFRFPVIIILINNYYCFLHVSSNLKILKGIYLQFKSVIHIWWKYVSGTNCYLHIQTQPLHF